jgi:hypothetical protein
MRLPLLQLLYALYSILLTIFLSNYIVTATELAELLQAWIKEEEVELGHQSAQSGQSVQTRPPPFISSVKEEPGREPVQARLPPFIPFKHPEPSSEPVQVHLQPDTSLETENSRVHHLRRPPVMYIPNAHALETTDKFNLLRRPLIKDMDKIRLTCWPNQRTGDRCHMTCHCADYPRIKCMERYLACLDTCICMEME